MASFLLPSSIQKRLLRYALSRLEFLDSEVLDLEHLDIRWGTRSVLEFKDVPLRLKKLETLLQLPAAFDLTKARILLLRITVPVDVYSSPILVEVDGVEAQLTVLSEGGRDTGVSPKARTDHDRKRDKSGGKLRRGLDYEANNGAVIPSADDLAASFLQTEPEDEKKELEAAISSQSQFLASSIAPSDDGEDEMETGIGAGLALPAFMANFLKGIVDRLQVKVRGIILNLDVNLPSEASQQPESPMTGVSSSGSDTVTLQVSVEDVDIEGVTFKDAETGPTTPRQGPPRKDGKRLINLQNLRGMLISDATLFASLARSSALSSPSVTQTDLAEPRSQSWASRSRMTVGSNSTGTSENESPEQSRHLPTQSIEASVFSTGAVSHGSRFDDPPEDEDGLAYGDSHFEPVHPRSRPLGDSILDDSLYLDQVTDSQILTRDNDEEDLSLSRSFFRSRRPLPNMSPLSTPRASTFLPADDIEASGYFNNSLEDPFRETIPAQTLHSEVLPEISRKRFSHHRVSQSQPLPFPDSASGESLATSEPQAPLATTQKSSSPTSDDSSQGSVGDIGEDLTQSMVFSHEDAESMYMSALSTGGLSTRLPGAWDDSVPEESEPKSNLRTPDIHDIPRQASQDNLEHALQSSMTSTQFHEPEEIMHASVTSVESSLPTPQTPENLAQFQRSETSTEHSSAPHPSREASTGSSASSDGPARIAKQLFSLDQAAIYVPPASDSSVIEVTNEQGQSMMFASSFDGNEHLAYSTSPNVPGAFSMRNERTRSPRTGRPATRSTEVPNASPSSQPASTEVNIGHFNVQFDISVGRIVIRLVQSVLALLNNDRPGPTVPKEDKPLDPLSFRFHAQEISFKFLDRLIGTMISSNLKTPIAAWNKSTEADVLLKTSIQGLSVDLSRSNGVTATDIQLQKFVFGYATENILSFNADLRMRESVRDLAAPAGVDISVNISQSSHTSRAKISALPLHVAIDLQRLDETFSWFGGLSGVLNMGSSIASTVTVPAASPAKSPVKSRGVRFEAPIKIDDKSMAAQNKVDARIGGFRLDLIGRQCSVGLDTTAVKIISREEGVAMAVDYVKISGPHIDDSEDGPAIVAEVTSTRLEFLNTPQDVDLTRLLALITPSKAKYDEDDDILLDTLLRQRRQGSVLRLTVDGFKSRIGKLEQLDYLPSLGEEVARLSSVAKYLPEDDRPGLLSLILVRDVDVRVEVNSVLGSFKLTAKDTEVAQITFPALVATSVASITLHRNNTEEVIGPATPIELREPGGRSPAIMARMIGDEMEPKVKLKLWNLCIDYRVPTLMALLDLPTNTTSEEMAASMANSIATLTGRTRPKLPDTSASDGKPEKSPMKIDIVMRDCILGLNPMGLPSKVLVVLTEAHVSAALPKNDNTKATAELSKGSILVIDDTSALLPASNAPKIVRRQSYDGGSNQVKDLCNMGFVSVSYISSAKAIVNISSDEESGKCVDVELRDDLFVLESCADSTQTLVATLNGLKPPTPPSTALKFRTKVIPVQDLLASLSGDAFGRAEGDYDFDADFPDTKSATGEHREDEENLEIAFDSHYIQDEDDLENSYGDYRDRDSREGSLLFDAGVLSQDTHDGVLLESYTENKDDPGELEELDFKEDHFGTGSMIEGTAHRWNSSKNAYDKTDTQKIRQSPLKVCVRGVHIIWNLFDGYDWQNTRNTITKAVQDVESKAIEKRSGRDRRPTFEQDVDDEETVIGDFLFNSIYIGIPSNKDPRDLAMAINQELNDNATETESIAPSIVSGTTTRPGSAPRVKGKRLRLNRSKHHKITFELRGVNVDLVAFPPGSGETESSIDVRIHDFDIFDHVPTSTWKKFATYMHDAGERESGASQIHIEILNVKPMPDLAASEIVMKVTVLPLRLHVDQDALDFITRFFEFKDDSAPMNPASNEPPFLQRVEVNAIRVKLDFKPKRVDYAGLRSGHTTEFMNFIVLDEASMVMRHTIIYGISGFDKLGKCLNDIWMPDIKRNQLPGILAGLAPVRTIANVGGGVRDLVMVPIEEYKKDGRVVRSLRKGIGAFGKTIGIEGTKGIVKIAVLGQTALQNVERIVSGPKPSVAFDSDAEAEEEKQISLYADQPMGVFQGLRGGYDGLARDLILARDAIIAIPGEVMESGSAAGAANAVGKNLPTIILKPMIGVSKAVQQTFKGINNTLDPQNPRRVQEKYKPSI